MQRPASGGCNDWRDRAACRGADPELFFLVGSAGPALVQLERAKRICTRCPSRGQCLEWALAHGHEAGVWGGTSEDERRALRPVRRAVLTASGQNRREEKPHDDRKGQP
ncbi:MAG TPA: WhiB family transcriptional regulator [Streptosporangiaceae bacterium]